MDFPADFAGGKARSHRQSDHTWFVIGKVSQPSPAAKSAEKTYAISYRYRFLEAGAISQKFYYIMPAALKQQQVAFHFPQDML